VQNKDCHRSNVMFFISSPKNKRCRVGSWVCQCVWGIAKLLLLCPCKFAKEFWIVVFPLHKMLKLIPWNDHNFNCWWRPCLDVTWGKHDPFRMVQEEVITQPPSMLQLNPFFLKQQKVHFIGFSRFLHHPQPHYNNLCLTLHKRNHKH